MTRLSAKRKLAFALVAVLLVLGGLELVFRLVDVAVLNARWHHHERLVSEIGFGELNHVLEPDPLRFWRLKVDLKGHRVQGKIGRAEVDFEVSTDASGRRRTPVVEAPKTTALFVGDSCTFGVGVDDEQGFACLLQELLPGLQSINAGVPGYTAFQGRRLLETLKLDPAPDFVVIAFLFNDMSPWDGRSDREHAAAIAAAESRWIRHSKLLSSLSGRMSGAENQEPKGSVLKPESARPRLNDEEYRAELVEIIALCRKMGSEPVLMVWPLKAQMQGIAMLPKQRVVHDLGAAEGVPVVDLLTAFREGGGAELFTDVVHANPAGNRVAAASIEKVLRAQLEQGK